MRFQLADIEFERLRIGRFDFSGSGPSAAVFSDVLLAGYDSVVESGIGRGLRVSHTTP